MRLAWTSDIHLNHANLRAWDAWADEIDQAEADCLVITGDLTESDDLEFQLRRITERFALPVCFVLGNHDFYGSSIAQTRRIASSSARDIRTLRYLTDSAPLELSPGLFMLGEDGWGDGTQGDYEGSGVRLSDFELIEDYRRVRVDDWLKVMHQQGAESAQRLSDKLALLPETAERVIVATHVPPFRESCWYQGRTTDDQWAPFFVCGQVGTVIQQFASSHPSLNITVLCGHTHHGGRADLLPNLQVLTASAEYGAPHVEQTFQF